MTTRIVTLDIERQSAIVDGIWQLKQHGYLRPSQIIVPARTICFAWKWLGDDEDQVNFSAEWDPDDTGNYEKPGPDREVYQGHQRMIEKAWEVLDEADYVIGWNSSRFDMGNLRSHMAEYHLGPPSPWKDIDLIKVSRSKFGFMSHKLAEVAERLGHDGKYETGGDLWNRLRWSDDQTLRDARDLMRTYNKRDVSLTEELYTELLPWIPNLNIYDDLRMDPDGTPDLRCRRCGSLDLQWRGAYRGQTYWYKKFQCKRCKGWGKSAKNFYSMETSSV